jgi:hypothetical protein
MCLLLPIPLIDPHVESLTINLWGHDLREFEEFQPFVDFFIVSEYNKEMQEFCNKANKNHEEYLSKSLTIGSFEMGWNTVLVPRCIRPWDIMEKTEQYLLWKKCYNNYINIKLKEYEHRYRGTKKSIV